MIWFAIVKIQKENIYTRLELNDLEPEEFVVSNGTPCDHYYEVLDAIDNQSGCCADVSFLYEREIVQMNVIVQKT